MHIPSERIYREMYSEEASLWFTLANDGEEEAILVKVPTASIKSMIVGCEFKIVIGLYENYSCSGIRIFDIPGRPLLVAGVQRYEEEHEALRRILSKKRVPLFLFNEMNFCVAWSNAELNHASSAESLQKLDGNEPLYTGVFSREASLALDNFCFSVDDSQHFEDPKKIELIEIPIERGPWTANRISVVGLHDRKDIVITNKIEGDVLEAVTWSALESVFPLTLRHRPQVKIGDKSRELIDVAASYEHGSIFFEAKDLSILNATMQRTYERRISSVQGHIKKAIGQLVGASKAVKRGELVFNEDGSLLDLNLSKPIHCIVLITEFIEDGDWHDVHSTIYRAMKETGDFFHVLDLRELVMLLKISKGKPDHFDYHLIKRLKLCIENKVVHVRTRFGPAG